MKPILSNQLYRSMYQAIADIKNPFTFIARRKFSPIPQFVLVVIQLQSKLNRIAARLKIETEVPHSDYSRQLEAYNRWMAPETQNSEIEKSVLPLMRITHEGREFKPVDEDSLAQWTKFDPNSTLYVKTDQGYAIVACSNTDGITGETKYFYADSSVEAKVRVRQDT